ncbi:MAG: hypothetical protein CL813_11950 [Confluentimicrobium sp.]|nr:hypothetical protein [Pacificitalea manganoxidans]MAQ44872.1 hypothetical protein [Actibacterium sp.]MBF53637.1 hypothetical protein [Actibacterium sp.]MDR6307838.1 hypothetical protein [Pacificitalea manganoxidans]|tara:strand:+ start:1015 stop:1149 length:135 start_codon:yes stop_codon:yes gene_type:complete
MGKLIKLLLILVILGGLALIGFAYLGDLTPSQTEVTEPVTLDVD